MTGTGEISAEAPYYPPSPAVEVLLGHVFAVDTAVPNNDVVWSTETAVRRRVVVGPDCQVREWGGSRGL
jgi:hypothetical protein